MERGLGRNKQYAIKIGHYIIGFGRQYPTYRYKFYVLKEYLCPSCELWWPVAHACPGKTPLTEEV